jgi:branched-chain amino acid transport system permease protein
MLVLGGIGSVPGALLGTAALTIVPELLRSLQEYRMFLFGAVMLVMMVFRPQGLLGAARVREELRPATDRIRREEDDVLAEERRA